MWGAIDSPSANKQEAKDVAVQTSRVISCAIHFPLDSVKFSEKQVIKCITTAKLEAISYIHVICQFLDFSKAWQANHDTKDKSQDSKYGKLLVNCNAGVLQYFNQFSRFDPLCDGIDILMKGSV